MMVGNESIEALVKLPLALLFHAFYQMSQPVEENKNKQIVLMLTVILRVISTHVIKIRLKALLAPTHKMQ